jgi:hypothetical protein
MTYYSLYMNDDDDVVATYPDNKINMHFHNLDEAAKKKMVEHLKGIRLEVKGDKKHALKTYRDAIKEMIHFLEHAPFGTSYMTYREFGANQYVRLEGNWVPDPEEFEDKE